jgi:predicted DCC family thiol-disulfide oxidoreductase YuxK
VDGDRGTIVFFDGACGLCNRLVDLLLRLDRRRRLRFAPLQGATARARLPQEAAGGDALVVLADGVVHRESGAVAVILGQLGGAWRILGEGLRLVPGPVRDGVYRWVGRRRYRWFGWGGGCRRPSPGERGRFLD